VRGRMGGGEEGPPRSVGLPGGGLCERRGLVWVRSGRWRWGAFFAGSLAQGNDAVHAD